MSLPRYELVLTRLLNVETGVTNLADSTPARATKSAIAGSSRMLVGPPAPFGKCYRVISTHNLQAKFFFTLRDKADDEAVGSRFMRAAANRANRTHLADPLALTTGTSKTAAPVQTPAQMRSQQAERVAQQDAHARRRQKNQARQVDQTIARASLRAAEARQIAVSLRQQAPLPNFLASGTARPSHMEVMSGQNTHAGPSDQLSIMLQEERRRQQEMNAKEANVDMPSTEFFEQHTPGWIAEGSDGSAGRFGSASGGVDYTQGSFGSIYIREDRMRPSGTVAVAKRQAYKNKSHLNRIREEVETIRACQHPEGLYVVNLLGAIYNPEPTARWVEIIMEKATSDLRKLTRSQPGKRLLQSAAGQIWVQLLEAVEWKR